MFQSWPTFVSVLSLLFIFFFFSERLFLHKKREEAFYGLNLDTEN